jgi:hypothetical protein
MSKYRDLAKKALEGKKNPLNENMLYSDGITERIHPKLEEDLRRNAHSLAECDIFPEGDIISSEMKLIRERFKEVVKRCREAFDMDTVDNDVIMSEQMNLVHEAMGLEAPNKAALEQLAVEMIMEEFDIPEGSVDFEAELTSHIDHSAINDVPKETLGEEFNDHEEIVRANAEVKKRRAINALIQGASKSVNHMFHMVHEELSDMNSRLPGTYKKMMSAADMMYYIIPDMDKQIKGGCSECDYTENEDGSIKPVIKAKGMVFPVLIHELCKGVMEVLSTNGLPTQENVAQYVIDKADFMQAEPWDMRFGPAIWRKFCDAIPADDFKLKHYVYTDLASMEPEEFSGVMKEVIAGTKRGKSKIAEMVKGIKKQLEEDAFNESMGDDHFNMDELL